MSIRDLFATAVEEELNGIKDRLSRRLIAALSSELTASVEPPQATPVPHVLHLMPAKRGRGGRRVPRKSTLQTIEAMRDILEDSGAKTLPQMVTALKQKGRALKESGIRDMIRRSPNAGLQIRLNVVKLVRSRGRAA